MASPFKPLVWKRFIENIFSLWNISMKEVYNLVDFANTFHPAAVQSSLLAKCHPPEVSKIIWSSLFLFTRKLAYVRIKISSNTRNGYTVGNQEKRLFSTRQYYYFGVTHCENSEVQIAVQFPK